MGKGNNIALSRGVLALPILCKAGAVSYVTAPPENELRASGGRILTGYSRLLKRMMEHVWNLGTLVWLPLLQGMTKTADDRRTKGRSFRSSPGTGKPSTWRREAVDRMLQQEMGLCPAW